MATAIMSDVELQRDVLEELKWDPSVDAANIGVSVTNGVVTLSGNVPTLVEKYSAERAAKRVHGVRAVANELEVKLPGDIKRTDQDIALDAVKALETNVVVPADRIKIIVSNGLAELSGDVDWEFQKEAAESIVRNVPGVTGLTNLIRLRSRPGKSGPRSRTRSSGTPRWNQGGSPWR
ncbi:MAG TPA: BON domain-containing protein [Gemmataceae bacterium]|nr:BON domain-containing protein [Gemmataceae bacterium]